MDHTLAIASRIRQDFGYGGANFPGATELYARVEATLGHIPDTKDEEA